MKSARSPLSIHRNSPWVVVGAFFFFLALSAVYAFMTFRTPSTRLEVIVSVGVAAVVWGGFFAVLVRFRQEWVELHADGLVHHKRDGEVRLPWEQVMQYKVNLTENPYAGGKVLQSIWSRLADNGKHRFSRGPSLTSLTLYGQDGDAITLQPRLLGFFSLAEKSLDRVDAVLTLRHDAQLRDGQPVAFGEEVLLTAQGLSVRGELLPLAEIAQVRAIDGQARVQRRSGSWVDLGRIPNAYALMSTLRALRTSNRTKTSPGLRG
jgi:hypothetical protein